MEFFLAIALGIGTYHGLLEVLHLSEGFSEASGWIVGISTVIVYSSIKKMVEHKRKVEILKLKAINKKQFKKEEKDEIEIEMDFFKSK